VGYIYLSNLLAVGTPHDLKLLPGVTPPGTRWLEIHGADSAALLESLRHAPGVLQATIFGQSIHALVEAGRTPAELGVEDARVLEAEPSLEDVFVTLSRAQEWAIRYDPWGRHSCLPFLFGRHECLPHAEGLSMTNGFSMQRTASVARKEFLHIIRDPATLFFALFIPVLEMFHARLRHRHQRTQRPHGGVRRGRHQRSQAGAWGGMAGRLRIRKTSRLSSTSTPTKI